METVLASARHPPRILTKALYEQTTPDDMIVSHTPQGIQRLARGPTLPSAGYTKEQKNMRCYTSYRSFMHTTNEHLELKLYNTMDTRIGTS